MRQSFTHYWKNATWPTEPSGGLSHTAGNQFHSRGVERGDRIYIVTVMDGRLLLGGRIVVDRIVDPQGAAKALGTTEAELWQAEEHALCKRSEIRPFINDLEVPNEIARKLRFGDGEALAWEGHNRIHRQTLRGVRQLTENSARVLDDLLSQAGKRASVRRSDIERYAASGDSDFDVSSIVDARERIVRAISRRQGQRRFRQRLLRAYGGRCAISGCSVEDVLEAAHILPYRGRCTNHTQNGLILRADLHTLFDLNLVRVLPDDYRIAVDESIESPEYRRFDRQSIRLPRDSKNRPSREALRARLESLSR